MSGLFARPAKFRLVSADGASAHLGACVEPSSEAILHLRIIPSPPRASEEPMGGPREVRESTVRGLWVHARVIRMQVEMLLMWPRACWGRAGAMGGPVASIPRRARIWRARRPLGMNAVTLRRPPQAHWRTSACTLSRREAQFRRLGRWGMGGGRRARGSKPILSRSAVARAASPRHAAALYDKWKYRDIQMELALVHLIEPEAADRMKAAMER